MAKAIPIRGRKPSEGGYMLLAVICMMVLLLLSLAVAAPKIAKSIQRDREVETMQRGKQYIRAIRLYYRKYGAYPPSIDALVNTNNIKFLRKKYIDPMTGKDDWKPVLFGQNKAPLAMGFFGQPLGGGATPIAGIGPSGNAGTGLGSSTGSGLGSGSGSSGNSFGSSFGGSSGSSSGSSFGSSSGSSLFGSSNSGTGSTNSTNGSNGATGSTGTDANGNSTSGSGSGNGSGTSSTGFMSGQTGQTFGGGGIIGVEPVLDKPSILIYKKKDHYNQWEFTYSPLMDMMQEAGGNAGTIGQPASGMPSGTPGTGSSLGGSNTGLGGSSFGGSSFGGSNSGGSSSGSSGTGSSSGSSGVTPTQPQPQ